jgi:hypothetical protein
MVPGAAKLLETRYNVVGWFGLWFLTSLSTTI